MMHLVNLLITKDIKTTHPNARSKWTRMSWNKGMALSEFSSELKGRNRNQNGISRGFSDHGTI